MACVRQLESHCFLYLTLISLLLPNVFATTTTTTFPTSQPECSHECGNISIPYPFGTGPGCYRNDRYLITCNKSDPPKPLIGSNKSNIELMDINIISGEARAYKHIAYRCYKNSSKPNTEHSQAPMDLGGVPFVFSKSRNKFSAIGCDTLAYIEARDSKQINGQQYLSGCYSYCGNLNSTTGDNGSCNGLGCCQTSIPAGLNYYRVKWGYATNFAWQFNPCMYAVLVEEDWYKFQVQDLHEGDFYNRNKGRVPIVLDWAIRDNGTCLYGVEYSSDPACRSTNSFCYNTSNGEGYLCNCSQGYQGNPYLSGGCLDINECDDHDAYLCNGICKNKNGTYECPCKRGQQGDGKKGTCADIIPYPAQVAIGSILGIALILGLCFLVAACQQHKKHLKEKEEYQRYYQMMDNHLRVFSKKQIEIATGNFGETHVLGAGGQGKVYKGVLENNQVAIKKSKEVEETQRGEFVNEILLLSQINHKNVVRLLGCCLEVKIPMLVYEFVPNGTLFELLHEKRIRISLGIRLQIASESAEALDYLHSCISRSILHGDVKSANILLDNDCRAKVSDFGASNLVPIDDTQVVKVVQGTRGYLDPEYVATAVLTKKSDVYSFGVVLLELITRKLAIFRDGTSERKHLASYFVSNARKNQLHELLDKDIVTTDEKVIEVLQEVSDLAVWCLSVRGEDRPTMRQVKEKLQNLVNLHNSMLGPEEVEEEKQSLLNTSTWYITSDSSAFHSTSGSSVLEIEPRVPR